MTTYDTREVTVYPNAEGLPSQFEVADDEEILNTFRSGTHELVVWLARPTTADRCMAITSDDTRCQNDTVEGSDYCHVPAHNGDDE